ncbi:MAG: 3-methyl-2-oxobutanoate hydroxymethyltransferase [Candidatus Omnitrophica bacterium]|nr:3-methyl-2-oxobutanoate hydroxymethyltransferase [Candidatus Omnitrophota bacterium]
MERRKITIPDILEMKRRKQKITMLTAYDYPFASLIDQAEIDIILVGDSLGNVILGYDSTVPVTMEEMLHHTKAVRRAVRFALLVGDMPFMSFNIYKESAIRNAGRFIKEAGCDAVKLEWFSGCIEMTKAIINSGIPVMGHIGLTPQTTAQFGGFKVRGKDAETAKKLIEEAILLEEAGCFSIVLECIPDRLAKIITEKLKIPTIGIGAGPFSDGQVLVTHDMVGLFERFRPKFVKQYINLSLQILEAIKKFKEEVIQEKFPTKEHSFTIKKKKSLKKSAEF